MKNYTYKISVNIEASSDEDAKDKIEKYCEIVNKFSKNSNDFKVNFKVVGKDNLNYSINRLLN